MTRRFSTVFFVGTGFVGVIQRGGSDTSCRTAIGWERGGKTKMGGLRDVQRDYPAGEEEKKEEVEVEGEEGSRRRRADKKRENRPQRHSALGLAGDLRGSVRLLILRPACPCLSLSSPPLCPDLPSLPSSPRRQCRQKPTMATARQCRIAPVISSPSLPR
jgi:hypothetical protein